MDKEYIENRIRDLDKNINKITQYLQGLNINNKDIKNSYNIENDIEILDENQYISYRNVNYDKYYINEIESMIENMPESNGSRYHSKININCAIVTDEFMYNYYKDAMNLLYVNYDNYKEIFKKNNVDIFIFVSCWKGMSNSDWRGISSNKQKKEQLHEIINYCKINNITTIFQTIEDPSNYEYYIDIAKLCDYIFTSASEKINQYKKECENENVYLMEFGINPIFHNPIGIKKYRKLDDVLFSGSWAERYQERCDDMKKIFDGVLDSGRKLKIIDRNFDLKSKLYFFPQKYIRYISPAVEHDKLQKVHKLYDWSINLNSIKYSPTMCAMRVYELQALGNVMLSNYSIAVNNKHPNIFLVNDSEEVESIMNSFTNEELYKYQINGIRNVISDKTVFDRINYMLQVLGKEVKCNNKRVLVLVEKVTEKIKSIFDNQCYKDKCICEVKYVSNELYENCEFVTFFAEDKKYEEYYIQDMINAFKYTNCDYITKDSYYDGQVLKKGIEHDYVDQMKSKYRTIFDAKVFDLEMLLNINEEKHIGNGYSIDRFEFNNIYIDERLDNKEKVNYEISVIIPVYNNGFHLLNKCINSLKRSSIFESMEIVIVDDGSTDEETIRILHRLDNQYRNIKLYRFNDNGSGSASRPRNKGFEISTGKYITYLDPDNEAVSDGYHKLYKELANSNCDMVVGYIKKLTDKETIIRYSHEQVIEDPKQHIVKSNFKGQSIQAALIRRNLIEENTLDMVNGAIGQDTLFFIELMLNAKKVKIVNVLVHIYYAAVSGSAVNKIDIKFFQKSFLLEKDMVHRLDKYDVLNEYVNNKFEFFYKNWYMEKFKLSSKENLEEIASIMEKIFELYSSMNHVKDDSIKQFISFCSNCKFSEIKQLYMNNN